MHIQTPINFAFLSRLQNFYAHIRYQKNINSKPYMDLKKAEKNIVLPLNGVGSFLL